MNETSTMRRAFLIGILGSFFFAFTFVLNRSMNLSGGSWLWSAALRYYFTLPIMALLLIKGNKIKPVIRMIREKPVQWILWSTIGFGMFYMPLCAASIYAESWFTCAAWQITIVCGIFLTPLFGKRIPLRNLLFSAIILAGIFIMQLPKLDSIGGTSVLTALLLIIIAAFSYPFGNRKIMTISTDNISTIQRVFGMTLCSMPFFLVCGIIAGVRSGAPGGGQVLQSFFVALFSGVIATILFFHATDMVKGNIRHIAVIEATQSGEVIFTLILGIFILHDNMPSPVSFAGILLILTGMILNSLKTK